MNKKTKRILANELLGFMDEIVYGAAEFVEDTVFDAMGASSRYRRAKPRPRTRH